MNIEQMNKLFSLFHDGGIDTITRSGNNLLVKIDIEYIAELIKDGYSYFTIKLIDVETFYFDSLDIKNITQIDDIQKLNIEILGVDEKSTDTIKINCFIYPNGFNKPNVFGQLNIKADAIEILDQSGKSISYSDICIALNDKFKS